jgi:hypothetical protein
MPLLRLSLVAWLVRRLFRLVVSGQPERAPMKPRAAEADQVPLSD